MKRTSILSAILIFTIAVLITSCGSNRKYYSQTPPPRYRSSTFSLIITPIPGFTMNRNSDGRYYHRSPQGYIYWKGYDNRFYLDRKYIGRVHYDQREYNEWKQYNRSNNSRRHY